MESSEEKKQSPPAAGPKPKPRLIVRLGVLLASHHVLFSAACCAAAVVALLLLPALAKNTYISENALIPGSANPVFSTHDVKEAKRFIKGIDSLTKKERGQTVIYHALGDHMQPSPYTRGFKRSLYGEFPDKAEFRLTDCGPFGVRPHYLGLICSQLREVRNFIAQHMKDVGAEVYHHKFVPHTKHFHPMHIFTSATNKLAVQPNGTYTYFGVNTVGIVRAPRGDGKEAIVLVSPYNSQNVESNEILSLGLAFSVFSLFSRAAWLAKDIVWLVADTQFGEYTAVSMWLNQYHNPIFLSHSGILDDSIRSVNDIQNQPGDVMERENLKAFKRAGTMAAALITKVVEKDKNGERDRITMYAEATNGQMPNLDLLNVVHYLAVHRQGFRVNIETFRSLLNSGWLKFIAEALQKLGRMLKTLNPDWKLDITVSDYVEGTANLASSMYNQALGVPTGSHGAFRDYQVDAVSLEFSPTFYLRDENAKSSFLLRGGRLMEGVVRSVNNLLEKFHQSFFLYFLTAPSKFISVGVYMIPFALLVAPLPIVAAALFDGTKPKEKSEDDTNSDNSKIEGKSTENASKLKISSRSWKWLLAAKEVLVVQLWAVFVSLLPYYISQIPNATPAQSLLIWAVFSVSALIVMYLMFGSPYSTNVEWELLKASMIAAISIGLGLMSIINFSTAQIDAVILIPMCLFARPLKAQLKISMLRRTMLLAINIVFLLLGFPPAAMLVVKGLAKGFGTVNIGDFWVWMEFLWEWNSATYLYLFLVHLPCWLLCIHVLLHPCCQVESKDEAVECAE